MLYAFQYTTMKMIIFCACKNLSNNKKAVKDTPIVVLKCREKFLVK